MGINATLKELKKNMDDTFEQIADKSRTEYLKSVQVGSPAPATNKIYGESFANEFREKGGELYSKALDAINKERERIADAKTTAPSSEAVNAIQLLRLTNVTAKDIENMVAKYGDNYSSYRAIKSIAKDAGVVGACGIHPLDKASDGLDYIAGKLPSAFSHIDYLKDGVQPIKTIGFNVTIDNELPEE